MFDLAVDSLIYHFNFNEDENIKQKKNWLENIFFQHSKKIDYISIWYIFYYFINLIPITIKSKTQKLIFLIFFQNYSNACRYSNKGFLSCPEGRFPCSDFGFAKENWLY